MWMSFGAPVLVDEDRPFLERGHSVVPALLQAISKMASDTDGSLIVRGNRAGGGERGLGLGGGSRRYQDLASADHEPTRAKISSLLGLK